MPRSLSLLFVVGLLAVLPIGALRAADSANTPEARLRDALRNTMLQLRTSENDRATLQSAQTESLEQNKALGVKVDALAKQGKADRDAAEKTITGLNAKVSDQTAEIGRLKESLGKWEAAYKQAAEVARTKEAERAKLADNVIMFERTVADQKTKNAALFQLGNEILTRYEKFGLGEALSAKEPFVGIIRVKLETFVQDYQDKLVDQRIKP